MASFAARDARCRDCGERAEPAVVTDLFRDEDGLPGAVDGAGDRREPLCFPCYAARLGGPTHGAALALRDAEGRSGRCHLVLAAAGVDARDRLLRRVERTPLGDRVEAVERRALHESYRDGPVARDADGLLVLGRYAARELARGVGSESRHVYRGTAPRGSAIDARSHLDDATREAIGVALLDAVVDRGAHRRVRSRDAAGRVAADAFPTLAAHGALFELQERLWRHVRDDHPDVLTARSRAASANQDRGRAFERCFERLCERCDLEARRPSDEALAETDPAAHARLVERFGASLRGVPDYFVAAPAGQTGLRAAADGDGDDVGAATDGGDVWRPSGDCFVEVKAGGSRLTREQELMVPHLKALGYPVYVLRGEPGDHRFDRR